MNEIVIVVPVLNRPHRAGPLVESITTATKVPHRILFVCSLDDHAEIDAARRTGADLLFSDWKPGRADWARKLNFAYRSSEEPYLLLAADDLDFQPGWDDAVLATFHGHEVGVVGTNDDANPLVKRGLHSTHPLIARWYADECGTVDGPGQVAPEAYWHNWCCPPETPIWMGDLTFRRLEDVRIGDQVMGWRSVPSQSITLNRLYRGAVEAISVRQAELVRVVMESGHVLRCTPDHRWYNARSPIMADDPGVRWITPKAGRTLLRAANLPAEVPAEHQRLAGWLAGIYDGEGSGVYVAMQSPARNPEVVDAIDGALQTLGVAYSRKMRAHSPGRLGGELEEFILNGGRQGYLDFLLRVQPVKRQKLVDAIIGTRTGTTSRRQAQSEGAARFGMRDRIVSVEPDGYGDVISLKTTTGNYVAWGYASKNCDNEIVETARARGCWAFARGAVVRHLHPVWGTADDDDTYRRGQREFREDHRLFLARKKLWAT